ncbi:hypothetical protein HGRIS_003808 [Hohenbuehelia grisea]|uniref:Uncharacterized protein n=1 Tax=Hohenbuehelia grisea TaxID=104357 RepID=A0ABR3JH26_9AGAR
MGSPRGTKDVDVVVRKPFLRGFDKIHRAFSEHPDFKVIPGTRKDGIRAICITEGVGVDILIQELPGKLNELYIAVDDKEHVLPCFPMKNMVLKKIHCLAVREKSSDLSDLEWLYDERKLEDIDWSKIAMKVKDSGDIQKALKIFSVDEWPFMRKLLELLGIEPLDLVRK